MVRKALGYLGSLFVAITVTVGILHGYSYWLDQQLKLLDDKKVILDRFDIKDYGLYLLQRSIRKGDFILLGSSELTARVPQDPINLFPNQSLPLQIDKSGTSYKQSLLTGIMLGALPVDDNTKMAMIVSMQWFFDEDISRKGTQKRFSELQYYAFMHNDSIPSECKHYASKRLATLLSGEGKVGAACLYAKLNSSDSVVNVLGRSVLYPFYECKYRLLLLRDKYNAYKFLTDAEEVDIEIKDIDWQQEQIEATKMGKENCNNNGLYVYNEYYNEILLPRWEELKDGMSHQKLINCKEGDDYHFFLTIAKIKNVKPYMVFMSANGWYYDYLGITKDKRYKLYDWLAQETSSNGFSYLDTRSLEYEPYSYHDVMHLGWKGWLYVGENISKHFGK